MTRQITSALFYLVLIGWTMRRRGISGVHCLLAKALPVQKTLGKCAPEHLCRAIDIACILYWKPILCLQRSAATTLLLRRHGFSAELVIGARIAPFSSHAWVELRHVVLNDKPYISEMYRELVRC
jgi:hypothetical protein